MHPHNSTGLARATIGAAHNARVIDTNGEIFKFCKNIAKICVGRYGVEVVAGTSVKRINLKKGRYQNPDLFLV